MTTKEIKISSELLDALIEAKLSGRQYKLILTIIRKTYGESKDTVNISLKQLEAITGIDRGNISKVLKDLEAKSVILTIDKIGGIYSYKLNTDYNTWIF